MANSKSKGGSDGPKVNKSALIREALLQQPNASSKEIVAILGEKGIKVAPTLVYYIKSKTKRAKRRQKRERVAESFRKAGTSNPVELILRVRGLASQAGGMRYLKQLVDALAE